MEAADRRRIFWTGFTLLIVAMDTSIILSPEHQLY